MSCVNPEVRNNVEDFLNVDGSRFRLYKRERERNNGRYFAKLCIGKVITFSASVVIGFWIYGIDA